MSDRIYFDFSDILSTLSNQDAIADTFCLTTNLSKQSAATPLLAGVIHLVTIGHILHVFQSKTTQYHHCPLQPKHGSECQFALTKTDLPF
jgi:hypothetical protein